MNFSDAERVLLRASGQRLQFAKLAEAARATHNHYVGVEANATINEFVWCLRWLCGGNDRHFSWERAVRALDSE